jgi:hypothetical protein
MPGLSRSEVRSTSSDLVHFTQRMGPPACGNSCGAASGRSASNMRSSFSWPACWGTAAMCCAVARQRDMLKSSSSNSLTLKTKWWDHKGIAHAKRQVRTAGDDAVAVVGKVHGAHYVLVVPNALLVARQRVPQPGREVRRARDTQHARVVELARPHRALLHSR